MNDQIMRIIDTLMTIEARIVPLENVYRNTETYLRVSRNPYLEFIDDMLIIDRYKIVLFKALNYNYL